MRHIPTSLIVLRALLGFILIGISILFPQMRMLLFSLVIIGFLSDVFDGIIARKLGVSTARLRRADSIVDIFFWICVAFAGFWINPGTFGHCAVFIYTICGLELSASIVSMVKFGKAASCHAYSAKFFCVTLLVFFSELILAGTTHTFLVSFISGAVAEAEILMIVLLQRTWACDVRSFVHAIRARKAAGTAGGNN